jgi:hypothetical protein
MGSQLATSSDHQVRQTDSGHEDELDTTDKCLVALAGETNVRKGRVGVTGSLPCRIQSRVGLA